MHTSRRPVRGGRSAALGLALALSAAGCTSGPDTPSSAPEVAGTDAGDDALDLTADLDELADGVPGVLGLVLLAPDGEEVATLNPDHSFTSASLYKLFLAQVVLDRVDRGETALEEVVPGSGLTVEDALDLMITRSENSSAAALGEWLGWAAVESSARDEGFRSTTFDADNGTDGAVDMTTTPRDVAALLDRLRRGELVSADSTAVLRRFLDDQQLDYALPQGFSPDIAFAHKTGLLEQVSHDAGIVGLDGQEYVVAVLTDGWSDYEDSAPWFREAGEVVERFVRRHAAAAPSS